MALWRRGKPRELLHHSDRGNQYTSVKPAATHLVQTDDGRRVTVLSERRTTATVYERISIQERIGWFGTYYAPAEMSAAAVRRPIVLHPFRKSLSMLKSEHSIPARIRLRLQSTYRPLLWQHESLRQND